MLQPVAFRSRPGSASAARWRTRQRCCWSCRKHRAQEPVLLYCYVWKSSRRSSVVDRVRSFQLSAFSSPDQQLCSEGKSLCITFLIKKNWFVLMLQRILACSKELQFVSNGSVRGWTTSRRIPTKLLLQRGQHGTDKNCNIGSLRD